MSPRCAPCTSLSCRVGHWGLRRGLQGQMVLLAVMLETISITLIAVWKLLLPQSPLTYWATIAPSSACITGHSHWPFLGALVIRLS